MRKTTDYETVNVHTARTVWQGSFDELKALYVERDRYREECGPDINYDTIERLNRQIDAARRDERDFWQAYCEIAGIVLAS